MKQRRPLKIAVIGAGLVNSPDGRENWAVRAHLPALKALPDHFEVAAICTTRIETARASADRFGVAGAFDDIGRMFEAMPELDAVCVSVRPKYHHGLVMAALRAKKHVFCEQPLGISTAEAEEMHRLARENGLRTVVGHQSHYDPAALYMRELVAQGYVGEPLTFSHTYFASNYITPRPSHRQWLFQPEMGGHPGYRSGHSLERVTTVLGSPVTSISADMAIQVPERAALDTGGVIRSRQIDNMNYLLRVDRTIMGTMQVSFTSWFGTGDRFELYGTEGMLLLESARAAAPAPTGTSRRVQLEGDVRLYGARVDMKDLLTSPTPPEHLQHGCEELDIPQRLRAGIGRDSDPFAVAPTWKAFAEAIFEGRECPPSFADKLRIHRVWDAAERSVNDKAGWVEVDYAGIG